MHIQVAYQDSVQSFVRALRAPTDPPRPGDPQKIDIASEAWYATSFYVPRKAEVILEWCMTRLLKDGTRYPASNPASDLRYWKLLQGIFLSVRSKGSKTGSGSNTWLLTLLNRVPLLPIVLSVLSNSLNLPVEKRDELYLHCSKSLALVWSLAAPKFSPDNLLECFGAMLRVLNEETVGSDDSTGLIEICMLVTSSLHTALSNSLNKKKLSQAFMTSHIGVWLSFTSKERATYSAIRTEICDVGVEFLFNVDSLKQIAENTRSKPLFEALQTHISSSSPHLLSNLPFLMTAFTNAIKKRRSLFSSGDSSIADTHSLAMLFFSSCEEILRGVGALHGTQVWQSRLDLLKVVEDESLFSPRSEDTAVLLEEEVGSCVDCLASADDENVQIAVQCLCVLSRIDHDLVEAVTSRILSRFLTVLQSPREEYLATPAHEFLFLALSYHTKTRTLPVHISRLLDSCALPSPYLSSLSIRTSYDGLVASPALTTSHLDRLSKAVRTFITPGQTLDTAREVIGMLRDIWERFHDVEKASASDYERGARKKRRTSTFESTRKAREEDADATAVTFALATRIAAVVLSSLPLHTVTEAEQAKVQAIIAESFDGFVREAILASTDATISGSSDRRRDVWAAQVVGAAALRFLYTLQMSVPARHLPSDQTDLGDLAAVLKVDGSLPEYGVEIYRYLLHHESHPPNVQRQQVLFDAVLTFLEVHFPAHRSAPQAWLGRSSQLSCDETGSAFAAVALLRLLLDRNIQVVNTYASSAQQERLINLLHLADVELGYEDAQRGLSLATTAHECLHSANFWEQENIRSSFFAVQHARTSFLDAVGVEKPKKNAKMRASGPHAESQMCEAVKAYTFLLYAPTECFPKTSRNDFLRRAVVLDFLLGSMTSVSTHRALQVVRTFLAKTLSFLGSWEHEASGRYLHYLMTSPLPVSAEQVTGELVHGHLVAAFRAAAQGSTDALLDAIQICKEQPLLTPKDPDIPLRTSTQQLMDIAMADSSVSSFPPELAGQLSTLFEHVVNKLPHLLHRLASHNVTERDEMMSYSDILLLWSRVISFGNYLGHPKNPSPGLGTQIAQAVCPLLLPCNCEDSSVLKLGSAMHAVLVSELQLFSKEEDRVSHLQHIVTTCMVFMHPSMSYQCCDLDENMANLLRTLSSSEFSSYLQFVCEALSSNGLALDKTACLVHLISLAIHNAPENTLKIVQAYVKECLDAFVNSTKLSDAQVLRLPMLRFIKDLCSKKPASIRPQNVVSIWTFLSRILAGSKAHDPETNVAIFHEIVSILSALVRLRRDLVVTTLPHLCNIIHQLIFALRKPRPLLGAKQYSIVADTLPVWINPSHPLGVEESKDLTRLLTSLSTKTLVRVHSSSAELRKPESLTRPLSKHVTCVLQAYLDVLNDPLCVLATDIRRELQPGLFVLCDMLNEHTRDSLMVSALDAGGKAAMKGLWREYEKQRYTGKG